MEIVVSVSIYYLIHWILQHTEFPFTDDMMAGVFFLIVMIIIVYGIAIFGFIKIDEHITGTTLNVGKGILSLITGVIVSIVGMNLLLKLRIITTDFPSLLFISIIMTISIACLHFGLRMKTIVFHKNN